MTNRGGSVRRVDAERLRPYHEDCPLEMGSLRPEDRRKGILPNTWTHEYLQGGGDMSAEEQIESLANFIMSDEVPGWPNASEGAGDAAIRLIRELQRQAKLLFGLLDDIDSATDQARSNDKVYRRWVEEIAKRRFEVATTDGYEVTFRA